ncbi:hypothetical protein F3I34_16155 [Pantoea sp. Bo_5]|nr:hypothetical protein F3I56_14205 [Pantoea sp. VH_25]KAA6048961.1 hypothetical protein F3I34_16155 [Pantoea sp. Bo_5]KAA6057732.1 hypothetical protein F3I32_16150 [Pantoea sp. Bo_40]KAA6061736.1 hypothetical protein F3I29_15970 [Pantoea sp. Bo_3]KAA6076186.1 hypothetical protein F3I31_16155 [Pantoea sp. Bo_39]KAA6094442.1 hypothetical protein F3I26_16620 [Pantoea sp. Bo_19]KAA6119736.1 hypothetical protein F3I19_16150 [Pantoea sp. B_2]
MMSWDAFWLMAWLKSVLTFHDAMPGLKNELRYNRRTGLLKKAPQPLIPDCFQAYKVVTTGRACYVVL